MKEYGDEWCEMKIYLMRAPRNTWILVSTSLPFLHPLMYPSQLILYTTSRGTFQNTNLITLPPFQWLPVVLRMKPWFLTLPRLCMVWSLQPDQPHQILATLVLFVLLLHAHCALPRSFPPLQNFAHVLPAVRNVLPLQFCLINTYSSCKLPHDHCLFKEDFTDPTGRSDPSRVLSSSLLPCFVHMQFSVWRWFE